MIRVEKRQGDAIRVRATVAPNPDESSSLA
jgi:hypothetical protein